MTLIIFEGGEGVGKTTQIEKLYNKLKGYNFSVLKTREPGGTPLAEKIRTLFKEKTDHPPNALTELYLVSAARNEHVKTVLLPAIADKKIILCDRFLDSTYVYQSYLGGLPKTIVDQISNPVLHDIIPDVTFILDCSETVARQRMSIDSKTKRTTDRYDSSNDDLHLKILNGYREIYEDKYPYPNGIVPKRILIDASKNEDVIFEEIFSITKHVLEQNSYFVP